ncbi:MAG: AAA family ATPase [bacterium]
MAEIISVVNQKGGVGKTTTAVNLAAYLSLLGKFVLLVDIDSQANATSGLGINPAGVAAGIYEALLGNQELRDIILETGYEGLKLAPANINLAGANIELVGVENREFRLQQALMGVCHDYDYIIIDSPPSLGLLTVNGLVASDKVLIPIQAEYYALEGLSQLLSTIDLVRQNLKPDLNVLGALITMYDKRNKLSDAVMEELYKYFPNKIFRSVVPRNVKLAEAPSHGRPISHYDPFSRGGRAYERLARELIDYNYNNYSNYYG